MADCRQRGEAAGAIAEARLDRLQRIRQRCESGIRRVSDHRDEAKHLTAVEAFRKHRSNVGNLDAVAQRTAAFREGPDTDELSGPFVALYRLLDLFRLDATVESIEHGQLRLLYRCDGIIDRETRFRLHFIGVVFGGIDVDFMLHTLSFRL